MVAHGVSRGEPCALAKSPVRGQSWVKEDLLSPLRGSNFQYPQPTADAVGHPLAAAPQLSTASDQKKVDLRADIPMYSAPSREQKGPTEPGHSSKISFNLGTFNLQPIAIDSRNSMLLLVFFNLLSSSSIASTGGTPVNARRRITTRLHSSG